MSISDLSQWSDLSGISRISRSSSIRPLARVDSVINISEFPASSSFRESTIKLTVSSFADSSTGVSKVIKATGACQDSINEYARLKLIQDSVQEATTMTTKPGALQTSTVTKLKGILVIHEANKYLQLPNADKHSHEDLSVLGITDLPKIYLTHDEKRDINATVENMLREKFNKFIISYEMMGGTLKEPLKCHDLTSRTYLSENPGGDLLRWKDQIDEVCAEYYRDILKCADLMCQWQRLKYNDMKELNLRNAEYLLLQAQIAETQAKLTERTCALRMFKETPMTVDAFRILSDSLDDRIHEAREKLRMKKALKVTYEDVFSPGYDQVLNKYIELCNVIKKKEHLMDFIN